MRDTGGAFVRKYSAAAVPPQAEEQTHWRRAFLVEREGAAQSFCVSVRPADGREADGFPMHLYIRHKWLDRRARLEKLVLLFDGGAIYVEGEHLQRGLDALEEGKLKRIQVQDGNEIAAIKGRNADLRKAEEKEPIVSRAVVSPAFDALLEGDKAFAAIAKVIKEDYVHHVGNDQELAG
jgi:hypothetical protein